MSAETEVTGATARVQAFEAMKGLSRTSRELYWQEYTLGKRPLTQVLDAERDIFSAEAARIAAVADSTAAGLKAQVAVGLLVSKLRSDS
jgi:adhesin transport system outer membrane protein